jgi:hypothetical protein
MAIRSGSTWVRGGRADLRLFVPLLEGIVESSFAFGQVRRLDDQSLGLLESVVGSESGHHVGMCGNEESPD